MSENTLNYVVAGPNELKPTDPQIYTVKNNRWLLDFVPLTKLIREDFDYMCQLLGKSGLEPEKGYTTELADTGRALINNSRQLLSEHPEFVLLDEDARYQQLIIFMSDAQSSLTDIIKHVQTTKRLNGVNPASIKALIPMLELQYQLRTNCPLVNPPTEESKTALQIRKVYEKLLEFI